MFARGASNARVDDADDDGATNTANDNGRMVRKEQRKRSKSDKIIIQRAINVSSLRGFTAIMLAHWAHLVFGVGVKVGEGEVLLCLAYVSCVPCVCTCLHSLLAPKTGGDVVLC